MGNPGSTALFGSWCRYLSPCICKASSFINHSHRAANSRFARNRVGGTFSPVLSHHRAYRSVHGGSIAYALLHTLRVPRYPFAGGPRLQDILLSSHCPPFVRSSDSRLFGPSHFLYGTMASADFSQFVVTTLSFEYVYSSALARPPRVRTQSFSPSIRRIYMR